MLSADEKLRIHELLGRVAWAYDERRLDVMEQCFTEDTQMSLRIADGAVSEFSGRPAVLDLNRQALDSQDDQRRHVISNIFFTSEDGDSAEVTSMVVIFAVAGNDMSMVSSGLYEDRVVRSADGWQIAKRHLQLDRGY